MEIVRREPMEEPNIQLVKYTSDQRDSRLLTARGLTIPDGVPIFGGGNAAWDHYCKTLAYHQLSTNNLEYDIKYKRCIEYFRSTVQKMSLMRLLYLQSEVNFAYTPNQIQKKLGYTRQFIYKTVGECVEAGYVEIIDNEVVPKEILLNAWRHYAMRWWTSNEENRLASAFYRILHARDSVNIEDKIKNF